jgi:hypothetical protein
MKYLAVLLLFATSMANAQDSVRVRRNTIKVDLTSRFLYSNAYIISYERIVNSRQSFVVSVGYQEFPRTSRLAKYIEVLEDRSKGGFKLGVDYRFYLPKENKYHAPRGVYIGPYFTYLRFNNERLLEIDNNGTKEQANLNSEFTVFNLGFQLGYQFVFKDRWTIDLSFAGPSFSHYKYKMRFDGNPGFNQDDIKNDIILDLLDRFPFLENVVNDKQATSSGDLDTWGMGYRYQLMLGYRF